MSYIGHLNVLYRTLECYGRCELRRSRTTHEIPRRVLTLSELVEHLFAPALLRIAASLRNNFPKE
jgi:hypothetical protein